MLCRVLFVAAVVSYVLCVLLLSGIQKEDLDAGTLRKLQRYNVNIDAIADQKLQAQCLTENNLATTLSTLRINVEDETKKPTVKPVSSIELDTQMGASPAQWKKLLAYFKEQKDQNASILKKTTMQSILIQSDSNTDTLLSSMRSRVSGDIIDSVTRVPQNIVKNTDNQKTQFGLEDCDKTRHESSTSNYKTITERSNDVEYISKIVAEILSQRQLHQVKTSTVHPTHTFNAKKLVQDIDKILEENKRNEDYFHTNYSFNNISVTEKPQNAPEDHESDNKEEKNIIEALLNQLRNRIKLPITDVRNRFRNNVKEDLDEERKLTLYDGRDKISDILSITKNKPNIADQYKNNWLYVIDGQGIKTYGSELSANQKVVLFNQLSDHEKAFLCKTNNENVSYRKEQYRYKCPNVFDSERQKLIELTPEEQTIRLIYRPNERDKTSYSKSIYENYDNNNELNNGIWPYFFDKQNNVKKTKLVLENNSLHIQSPNHRYEPMKEDDPSLDDAYKRKWPLFSEKQRSTEQQKLESENLNLLFNRQSDRAKPTKVISEVEEDKINTYETPPFHLRLENNPKDSNYYQTEWVANGQSAKELEAESENKDENLIFSRIMNPNDPSFYGEFKNARPNFLDDIRITQKSYLVNKSALLETPKDREMSLNNHERMLLGKQNSIFNQADDREKTFELLSKDRSDPKPNKWLGMKIQPSIKDNQSLGSTDTGTFQYNLKDEHKSLIRDQTMNTKNNIGPNYKINKWPYFSDDQQIQNYLITTEKNKMEPPYYTDSRSLKHNAYEYDSTQNDTIYNKLLMNAEARTNFYQQYVAKEKSKNEVKKEDDEKSKSLSPDVLKVIADTVKEIVLKDLKTDTSTTSTRTTTKTTTTATLMTTRPATSTTTTEVTTTTISTSTTTPTPITVKTTIETKTDTKSTTEKENHIKIQEASKALENFMELFAKFNLMKNDIVKSNLTQTQHNITQIKDSITQNNAAVIATMPTLTHNAYAPYQLYSPLLPSINPYSRIRSPYLQAKTIIMDPYVQKTIQIPTTNQNNARKPMQINQVGRSVPALTFQTNSNQIAPLKIPVSKSMLVDNIVLSPKPPRARARHLREYSDETFIYRKPNTHQTQRNEFNARSNRSRDSSNLHFRERPSKPRSVIKEYNEHDRFYNPPANYESVRFHEKLEKEDNWARQGSMERNCGSKEDCNDRVAPRLQRPLISIASTYDDTHFRNFLKTQQKVNDMLERILATKTKHSLRSGEVI